MRKLLVILLLFPSLAAAFECNTHVYFGVPEGTGTLLCHDGYAVGYDSARKNPAWVAYRLWSDYVRINNGRNDSAFGPDPELPENAQASLADYYKSGYDRGHLAPRASVDFSVKSRDESYYLTNMTPQLPGFNQQGWRYLEDDVRTWARKRKDLWVVSGVIYEGDIGTIGNGVAVPSSFYKVLFDPATAEALAFIVPHRNVSKAELPSFMVTVDEVERRSGHDFLSNLPDDLEEKIESAAPVWWGE